MGEYLIAFILGGVAGIAIGLIVGRMGNSNADVVTKLNKELDEVKEKLKQQTEHFAESENMLHKIGTDLKDLYQHMSKNEISTLKEKFKGLVIEADAPVDEISHKAEEVGEEVKDAVEKVQDKVEEKATDLKEQAEEKIADVKEVVVEKSIDIQEKAADKVEEVKEKMTETVEDVKEKTDEVMDKVIDELKDSADAKDKK